MTTHPVTEQIVRVLSRTWWVVTAAMLVVGGAAQFDLISRERLGPLASASAEVAAPDGSQLAAVTDGQASVRYAGLELSLLEARAVPVNQSGRPIVVVDLAIRNLADVPVRIVPSMLRLVRPDGQVVEPDRFDYTERPDLIVLEPGGAVSALVVYKLGAAPVGLVSAHRLEIGEPGRWPVSIGLDGTVAEDRFPQPLAIDPTAGSPTATYQGLEVELLDARTALEHGVYRAPIGRHLAMATVEVIGPSAAIDRHLWTLTDVDGQRRALQADVTETSPSGDVATVELVFSYSTESSELSLMVGRSGVQDEVARFEVKSFE
ncbi:MAG: hypothetical protein AAF547_20105 [Actinomycetota bacterium]